MVNRQRFWKGRTVLVTGGAGAIGGNLIYALCVKGAERIVVLDDLSQGFLWRIPRCRQVDFVCGSVAHDEALDQAFRFRPTVVFHLAALFANQRSIEDPVADLVVNGLGTLKVLQRAGAFDVERLVYTASSSSHPRESRRQGLFRTPYQMTKLLGEFYCDFFSRQHRLVAIRPCLFNSYGPGDLPGRYRSVIPNFVYSALRGQQLHITGSGEETRDFTFVDDIVDGLIRSASSDMAANTAFDIGSGVETKITDLAESINRLTGNQAGFRCVPARSWDKTTSRLAMIQKAKALVGYAPSVSLEEGLCRTVDWFRNNWATIEGEMCSITPTLEIVGRDR